jgi:hypothetical protein
MGTEGREWVKGEGKKEKRRGRKVEEEEEEEDKKRGSWKRGDWTRPYASITQNI